MKKRTVTFMLLFSLLIAAVVPLYGSISAETTIEQDKKTISNLQNELKANQSSINKLKNEMAAAQNSAQSELTKKANYDKQIELLESEIELTKQLIEAYDVEKQALSDEINKKQAEYEEYRERMLAIIKYTYEEGSYTYLDIIIGSKNFSDFLTRAEIIGSMVEYNKNIATKTQESKVRLEEAQSALDEAAKAQAEYDALLESKASEFQALSVESQQLIQDYLDKVVLTEKELSDEQRLYDEVQSEIARVTKELAAKQEAQRYAGGELLWPAEARFTYISSYFINRTNPVTGKYEFHTGIDIPANHGTNVYAANDGEVILAKYNGGYGNCVVISHGGGITTLYGHNSKLLVSVGDKVKKGDVIAKVGTTGVSTGNHIHFEVSVDGVRKNPLDWFPQYK